MTQSSDIINRALGVVTDFLRERGRELGANIGHELRRQIPEFSPQAAGFSSLSHFLTARADDVVIVGQRGNDRVWALGASIPDRDLAHALEAETEPDVPVDISAAVTRIEFKNFRSCRDVQLDLAPTGLTVLVGPNSAGKSTVLLGASYISQVTRGRLRALFSGPRDVRRLRASGATGPMAIAASVGKDVELRLSAQPTEEGARFEVSLRSGANAKARVWTSPGEPPSPPLPSRRESGLFWPSVLLRFRSDALAEPSEIVEGEPRLNFDGSGLPTVLAHLATTEPERLRAVVDGVRSVVPSVEETRQTLRRWEPSFDEAPGEHERSTFRYQLDVKMKDAGWVPADMLSEGTLFAFGVHAVLNQRRPPRLLLLDDIDRGLHPKAQRALIQHIQKVAGRVQIITSTHSPYILDELPPESVRVVRAGAGGTRVRALIEHPEWQEWRASMTSGEFWTYVGEDWLEDGE